MTSETITIARADLTSEVSRALIGCLNDELRGVYSEPGATHFGSNPEEVTGGRGAFLIIYREELQSAAAPFGCSMPRRPNSNGCMWIPPCAGKDWVAA